MNTDSESETMSVASDWDGNTFAAGNFEGSVNFGGSVKTTRGATGVFITKMEQGSCNVTWTKTFGFRRDRKDMDLSSVKTDSSGDVYIAGDFVGPVNFGGTKVVSNGGWDPFVVKLSGVDGSVIWVKTFGGTGDDMLRGIAIDRADNIIAVGQFEGQVNFGVGGSGQGGMNSNGDDDIFYMKISGSDGTTMWAKKKGGTQEDRAYGVAVDSSGDAAIVGRYSDIVAFNGPFPSTGGTDCFIMKVSGSDGAVLWVKATGSSGDDALNGVTVDPSDNFVATGYISGAINVEGNGISSFGDKDVILLKYAGTDGDLQFVKTFGSSGSDVGNAIAADGAGDIFVTGRFQQTIDSVQLTSNGEYDAFLLRLDATTGDVESALAFGGAEDEVGHAIAIDSGGTVVLGGDFESPSFTIGDLLALGETDDEDAFVTKFASMATPLEEPGSGP